MIAIVRNLLLYRYNFLSKAVENAKMLGLKGALYPMINLDGIEGYAEWEISMMKIHRNSAIVLGILKSQSKFFLHLVAYIVPMNDCMELLFQRNKFF